MSPRGPNLSRVLFSQGSIIVRVRSGTVAYVAGRAVETSDSDRTVRLAARPISPSDRKLLPEGIRVEDSSLFLTRPSVVLKTEHSQANGAAAPDRVLWDGWWWKIVGEKPWVPNGFRRYIAIREDKGRERSP